MTGELLTAPEKFYAEFKVAVDCLDSSRDRLEGARGMDDDNNFKPIALILSNGHLTDDQKAHDKILERNLTHLDENLGAYQEQAAALATAHVELNFFYER